MPGPNDKKPSLFQQMKKTATAAPQKATASTTSRLDEQKRKAMLASASEEVRMRPDSATLNRGLLTAMAVDEAIKAYREALALFKTHVLKDAEKRERDLRLLKSILDEDIAAEPNKVHPSIQKLTDAAEALLREGKRAPKKA